MWTVLELDALRLGVDSAEQAPGLSSLDHTAQSLADGIGVFSGVGRYHCRRCWTLIQYGEDTIALVLLYWSHDLSPLRRVQSAESSQCGLLDIASTRCLQRAANTADVRSE